MKKMLLLVSVILPLLMQAKPLPIVFHNTQIHSSRKAFFPVITDEGLGITSSGTLDIWDRMSYSVAVNMKAVYAIWADVYTQDNFPHFPAHYSWQSMYLQESNVIPAGQTEGVTFWGTNNGNIVWHPNNYYLVSWGAE
jgi:hypothetical protein